MVDFMMVIIGILSNFNRGGQPPHQLEKYMILTKTERITKFMKEMHKVRGIKLDLEVMNTDKVKAIINMNGKLNTAQRRALNEEITKFNHLEK